MSSLKNFYWTARAEHLEPFIINEMLEITLSGNKGKALGFGIDFNRMKRKEEGLPNSLTEDYLLYKK